MNTPPRQWLPRVIRCQLPRCPRCGSAKLRACRSTKIPGGVERRTRCKICEFRFRIVAT